MSDNPFLPVANGLGVVERARSHRAEDLAAFADVGLVECHHPSLLVCRIGAWSFEALKLPWIQVNS